MSKVVGRNGSLYLDVQSVCRAMSAQVSTITLAQSSEAPETTSFGQKTRERLPDGLLDWELSFDSFFSSGASEVDETLSAILGGSTMFQFGPTGSAASSIKYSACGILTKYDMKFGVADAATVTGTVVSRSGSLSRGAWA